MIFDTKEIIKKREECSNCKDWELPEILLIDKSPELVDEKEFIEKTLSEVMSFNPGVACRWKKSLLGNKKDESNFRGAWFEIFLYKWLQEFGEVTLQPPYQTDRPDFLITIGDYKIYIEATAIRYSPKEIDERKFHCKVYDAIDEIQPPVGVKITKLEYFKGFDSQDFITRVQGWLCKSPNEKFYYPDVNQSSIQLQSAFGQSGGSGPAKLVNVDSRRFVGDLINKSEQHKCIKNAGLPYIIAFYSESYFLSSRQVEEAWSGIPKWIYDINGNFLKETRDKNGVGFAKEDKEEGKAVHKNVSGFLCAKNRTCSDFRGHQITAEFLPNINCNENIRIPDNFFPRYRGIE